MSSQATERRRQGKERMLKSLKKSRSWNKMTGGWQVPKFISCSSSAFWLSSRLIRLMRRSQGIHNILSLALQESIRLLDWFAVWLLLASWKLFPRDLAEEFTIKKWENHWKVIDNIFCITNEISFTIISLSSSDKFFLESWFSSWNYYFLTNYHWNLLVFTLYIRS